MDALLDFARGPLFRFSFAIMALGLLRVIVLDLLGAYDAYRKAGEKDLPWGLIINRSLQWFIPINRVFKYRPIYSSISILFHVGLLLVPVFLFAHVHLWKQAIGFGWFTLPKEWADWLTILTIVSGIALFIGRVFTRSSSFLSRFQDYIWPLLLLVPFVSGYICSNLTISPKLYQLLMLTHVLSAELIFVLMPFTKIAHCVLMPLSQFVSNLAWKFPANTDEAICTTLNKKGAPV